MKPLRGNRGAEEGSALKVRATVGKKSSSLFLFRWLTVEQINQAVFLLFLCWLTCGISRRNSPTFAKNNILYSPQGSFYLTLTVHLFGLECGADGDVRSGSGWMNSLVPPGWCLACRWVQCLNTIASFIQGKLHLKATFVSFLWWGDIRTNLHLHPERSIFAWLACTSAVFSGDHNTGSLLLYRKWLICSITHCFPEIRFSRHNHARRRYARTL